MTARVNSHGNTDKFAIHGQDHNLQGRAERYEKYGAAAGQGQQYRPPLFHSLTSANNETCLTRDAQITIRQDDSAQCHAQELA